MRKHAVVTPHLQSPSGLFGTQRPQGTRGQSICQDSLLKGDLLMCCSSRLINGGIFQAQ